MADFRTEQERLEEKACDLLDSFLINVMEYTKSGTKVSEKAVIQSIKDCFFAMTQENIPPYILQYLQRRL